MFNLLRSFLYLGAIIPPLPFNILDGQLIDAVPVMGNFNAIVAAVNANVPALVGNNTFVPTGSVGGTANAITLTPSPVIAAYAQGQTFTFQAIATNTGNTTIATSALAPHTVTTAFGANLTGQEIQNGGIYTVTDTGSVYILTNGAQGSGPISFTPGIDFGGGTTGITYTTQYGRGWKVNNIFYFNCNVVLSSKGTSNGDIHITGLPYVINAALTDSVLPLLATNLTIAGQYVVANLVFTGTTIAVLMVTSASTFTVLTDAECTNTTALAVQGWYPV